MHLRGSGGGQLGVLLLLFGCHKRAEQGAPAPSASVAPALASILLPVSSAPPSTVAPASDVAAPDVVRAVRAWSDSLDRHDLAALAGLYAESIEFYGHELTRSRVLEAKRAAFVQQPDFRQQLIGGIDVRPLPTGAFTASFTKRTDAAGKMLVVSGALTLARAPDGAFRVTRESDEATDKQNASSADASSCEELVSSWVLSRPQVKSAMASAQKVCDASGGTARCGGIGPTEDNDGLNASLGIHTDERFEPIVVYEVNRAGHLSVTVAGEDLTVPAAIARRVATACKR